VKLKLHPEKPVEAQGDIVRTRKHAIKRIKRSTGGEERDSKN